MEMSSKQVITLNIPLHISLDESFFWPISYCLFDLSLTLIFSEIPSRMVRFDESCYDFKGLNRVPCLAAALQEAQEVSELVCISLKWACDNSAAEELTEDTLAMFPRDSGRGRRHLLSTAFCSAS